MFCGKSRNEPNNHNNQSALAIFFFWPQLSQPNPVPVHEPLPVLWPRARLHAPPTNPVTVTWSAAPGDAADGVCPHQVQALTNQGIARGYTSMVPATGTKTAADPTPTAQGRWNAAVVFVGKPARLQPGTQPLVKMGPRRQTVQCFQDWIRFLFCKKN